MNKIISTLLAALAVFTLIVLPDGSIHVHDEECGYNLETQEGCVFENMPSIDPRDIFDPHR